MQISLPLLTILLPLTSAAFPKLQPGYSPNGGVLAARAGCTSHSTCDECYGDGYVVCSNYYCFAPGKGQQCCANGSYCVAVSNDCCDSSGGPGKTGHAGVPDPLPTDFQMPTTTGYGVGAVVTCSASNELHNDGFECCKKYNMTWSFCPQSAGCYLPLEQTCCTDGTICEGAGCCDLSDAKPTTPFPTGAQQTSSATDGGNTVTVTETGVGTTLEASSTPTGAAVTNAIGGAMVVAMGVFGIAML